MARGITGLSLSLSLSFFPFSFFHRLLSFPFGSFSSVALLPPIRLRSPLRRLSVGRGLSWVRPPAPASTAVLPNPSPPSSLLPSSLPPFLPSPPSARFFQLLLPIFTADKFWGFHQHFLILEINNHFPLPSSK